jgi:hypothetical protein
MKAKPKPGKARVTIGRWHNDTDGTPIHIEIENASTGKMVAEVRLSLADFAEALPGLRSVPGILMRRAVTR